MFLFSHAGREALCSLAELATLGSHSAQQLLSELNFSPFDNCRGCDSMLHAQDGDSAKRPVRGPQFAGDSVAVDC